MKIILTLALLFFVNSCGHNSLDARIKLAEDLAAKNSFKKEVVKTKNFQLLTYSKISNPQQSVLNIYIEGDGFAWRNKYTISNNPTPKNPMALRLAIVDSSPNVLYLARPCQYVDGDCPAKFWSGSRFSNEVINSTNEAITEFVKKYQFKKINLFGYSGGAAVAVLVASNRNDVAMIKTVAGNLNHKKLMSLHEVSPLEDSLDAIDVAEKVKNIPQYHLVGGRDKAVPPEIIISFVDRVNAAGGNAQFEIIPEADHQCEKWPKMFLEVNAKLR